MLLPIPRTLLEELFALGLCVLFQLAHSPLQKLTKGADSSSAAQ